MQSVIKTAARLTERLAGGAAWALASTSRSGRLATPSTRCSLRVGERCRWRGWVRLGARWKHLERPPAHPPGLGAAPLAPHPPGMPPAPVLPEADVHAEK